MNQSQENQLTIESALELENKPLTKEQSIQIVQLINGQIDQALKTAENITALMHLVPQLTEELQIQVMGKLLLTKTKMQSID